MISVSVVNPLMLENGWTFEDGYKVTPDPVVNARYLHQIYTAAQSDYSGRVTVPTLWVKKQGTIVSNESADIIRMFNSAFDAEGAAPGDYYPEELRAEIDAVNERVYDNVNNGVYPAGLATSQQAYEEAVVPLFATLDWLEDRLDATRYLCGARLTEADWRLLPRCSALIQSTWATSSATCAASRTTPTCRITCASCIRCRAWPKRWIFTPSSCTTTAATRPSIRRGWCLWARPWTFIVPIIASALRPGRIPDPVAAGQPVGGAA